MGDVSFAVAFLGRSRRKEKKKKGMETGEQGYLFIMLRFPEYAKYRQNNFVKNKEKKRKTKGMLLWKIDSVGVRGTIPPRDPADPLPPPLFFSFLSVSQNSFDPKGASKSLRRKENCRGPGGEKEGSFELV